MVRVYSFPVPSLLGPSCSSSKNGTLMISGWGNLLAAINFAEWSCATNPCMPAWCQSLVCSASCHILRLTRLIAVPALGDISTSYSHNGPLGTLTGKKLVRKVTLMPATPKSGRLGSSPWRMVRERKDCMSASCELSCNLASMIAGVPGSKILEWRYDQPS
jgi:hypothetical protein